MISPLIIGTRGSALALYQANLVQKLLLEAHPELEVEIKIVKTIGDKDRKTALAKVSEVAKVQRGIFIKELEEALEEEQVHIAVHSLKDMPSTMNEGFLLPTFLPRAAREDVLVSKHPDGITGLPEGATVATGGVRRQCQLKTLRPDLNIIEFRGNVPTRLKKTAENPEIDATMLAAAGLKRLEYPVGDVLTLETGEPLYLHKLSTEEFLPPGGQGVIAIECLSKYEEEIVPLLDPLNCKKTALECEAERAFMHKLGATCDTPVSIMATAQEGESITAEARFWEPDSCIPLTATAESNDPDELAKALVEGLKNHAS